MGALALPLFAAHNLADHPLQPSQWAAAKGGCNHEGRLACAKHTGIVVLLQTLALGVVVGLSDVSISPAAAAAGLSFTGWSHYWFDRRFTARGLYAALGKVGFADLGTPRPDRDDAPHLGTGAYRMDQDWHILWLAVSALLFASDGLQLLVLCGAAAAMMGAAILASRAGRQSLADQEQPGRYLISVN